MHAIGGRQRDQRGLRKPYNRAANYQPPKCYHRRYVHECHRYSREGKSATFSFRLSGMISQ